MGGAINTNTQRLAPMLAHFDLVQHKPRFVEFGFGTFQDVLHLGFAGPKDADVANVNVTRRVVATIFQHPSTTAIGQNSRFEIA